MQGQETSKPPLLAIVICVVIAGALLLMKLKPELFAPKAHQAIAQNNAGPTEEDINKILDHFIKLRDQGNSGITGIDRRDTDNNIIYLIYFGRVLETYEIQDTTTKLSEATIVLEAHRKTARGQIYFKNHKDVRPEVAEVAFVTLMQILAQGSNIDWITVYRDSATIPLPADYKYHPVGPLLTQVLPSAAITFDGHEKVLKFFGGKL